MAERSYHFIGIGGIGMSGLAKILLERGEKVSGSDISPSYTTENLEKLGAKIYFGQLDEKLFPYQTVVYSSAIKKTHAAYQKALKLQCPLIHRSEMLLELMQGKKSLTVSGTHGKTTTSALLAATLEEGGFFPSFSIGGILPQFQTNAKLGKGDFFVAEADESDGSFVRYLSQGAIVTNIDLDHMDHYKTEGNLIHSFQSFFNKVEKEELLFWCGDDKRLQKLNPEGLSYGFSEGCQLRCLNFCQKGWSSLFDVAFKGRLYSDVQINLIGKHSVLNAAAVFGLSRQLGVPEEKIRQTFKAFKGVRRRCEKKGEFESMLFLDDYAHHPAEISSTLQAIRKSIDNRRLIAVFQPHRFSRTFDCLEEIGGAFKNADHLIVTDIYGAGEAPIAGVSAESVLKKVEEKKGRACRYVPRELVVSTLLETLLKGDVVVTLGAGNITEVNEEVLKVLKR